MEKSPVCWHKRSVERTRKLLVMGLPGAGKTTLARLLAPLLAARLFNADEVRAGISRDLGFSVADRIEHARRMGKLCDETIAAGGTAIADFVCPTEETRRAFGLSFTIWVDRIAAGRYEDTNQIFEPPHHFDVRVTPGEPASLWARRIVTVLKQH